MKARLLVAHGIATLPGNALRVFLYRRLFGYRIFHSRIGWRTVLHVAEAELDGCLISHHNLFVGPMSVRIGKGASIGAHNTFECGWWTLTDEARAADYQRRLEIGESALITTRHHFDVAGGLTIGAGTWVAGIGSQFWTHGAGVTDRNVRIGERCYLGSAVRFAPGAAIRDNTMVALGSVVARRFPRENLLIGGVPAEVLRENYDWRTQRQMDPPATSSPPARRS